MAEDDGSFEAAKKHGKANNHEVIEHFRSMAPADNTAISGRPGKVDMSKSKTSIPAKDMGKKLGLNLGGEEYVDNQSTVNGTPTNTIEETIPFTQTLRKKK